MKNSLYILFFFILTSFLAVGSENPKMKRAEKLYASYAYKDAIVLYEDLVKQNIDVKKSTERLANCYRLINDMKHAEIWYAKHIEAGNYTSDDAYYYSMALRENGKILEADEWMEKFRSIKASDSRAKEFSDSKAENEKLKKKVSDYKIENLNFNTDGIEFSPSFYGTNQIAFVAARNTELIIKHEFAWNQTPYLDYYSTTKNSDGTFTNPKPIKGEINTKYHDGPGALSPDGNMLYFTRNNYSHRKKETSSDGVLKLKLYTATKNAKGEWTNISEFKFDDKEFSVGHPALSKDGNKLYFTSDMPGSIGGTDIWCSNFENGSWKAPVNMGPKINTEGNEMFPFVNENGDLFFASNGHFGLGGLDIFYAPIKNNEYNKIINLGAGINSLNDDFGLILDSENKNGYFTSNREGGKGDDDIYSVTLLKPLKVINQLKIKVIDESSKEILSGAIVNITLNGNKSELKTNNDGLVVVEIEPGQEIITNVAFEKYFPVTNKKIENKVNDEIPNLEVTIPLIKNEGYSLAAKISDSKTGTVISGAKLTFSGLPGFNELTTSDEGIIQSILADKKPGEVLEFKVKIEKEGYLAKESPVKLTLQKPGVIWMNEFLNINLDKLEVGLDIGKLIDIKPIYFDLGKYNIRKDAAVELDKIVKVMNEHPKMVIELGSHTDCRGSFKSNETLSDNRAKASAAYVVSKGIASERIFGKGYGESKLVNGCECEGAVKSKCSELEHQQNRRTEFVIVKMD